MSNLTIFDIMYKNYIPKKKIRLIEFFAGYGSQALALKYLNIPFEHWKICEWAVKSIQAYKDLHFENKTYNSNLSKEEYVDYLYKKGISSNYNEPMTYEQIKRLNEKQLKTIYNNIKITNNLVNIQQVKGEDLEIVNTDEYDYILTYSFPCQDLSLAGKGKGMSDTTTRSGAFASGMKLTYDFIKIPEATKKGYAIATDGDGVYINRPHQKRGVVQKDKIQTIKTSCDDIGVVTKGLRIRMLTPREVFRLMGVKDEDFEKVRKNQSESSLYHLAGDSLVTTVMMAIMGELFNINWQEKFNSKGWWDNEKSIQKNNL